MFENVRLSPAFLIRRFATPSPRGKGRYVLLPVIWGAVGELALGRCASIGPYETEEARTCTTNEISARIPHPSLRDTFPPGGREFNRCFLLFGCGGNL